MDLRRALLWRLLRAASLPCATALVACANHDTRCFEWTEERCPPPEEAERFIPRDCHEDIVSVDSDAERDGPTGCCYDITYEEREACAIPGRPLLVEAHSLTAAARERGDWVAQLAAPDVTGLDDGERETLAQLWTQAALFEHASIASFARFALQLMAVGAPPSLLEEAHRAASDEVRHASAAFALASAYRGAPVGPSRIAFPASLPVSASLEELAVSTAVEACVSETLAVLVAIEQLARAREPAVRAVLERIVEDESNHAALAWCTVRWAISAGGPQVRAAVARAFRAAAPGAGGAAESAAPANARLEAHGLLDEANKRQAIARGYAEVIVPSLARLLEDSQQDRSEATA